MAILFQINSGIVGSTGTIMLEIDKHARLLGMTTYMASVNNRTSHKDYPLNHIAIGTIPEKHIHRKLAAITGNEGGYTRRGTKTLLKKIDEIKPDILQIHNLHWDYINIGMLFDYIKLHPEIKVVWTLHDCWSYTGHCPYYDMAKCDLWKTECHNCKVHRKYPISYVDNSTKIHRRKKQWFSNLPNLTLVTPSEWLEGEVKQSFLKNYKREIIKNGIDTKQFSYTESNFKAEYNIEHKFVVLGIAYTWGERKGFDVFVKLSKMLDDRYKVVIVGGLSKDQIKECNNNNILTLPRISSKEKLKELYSSSDVFFNPTREEMFGLVNIEAQACGTPVITFNSGGSPECIGPECGYIVEKEDLNSVVTYIEKLYSNGKPLYEIMRKWAEQFDYEKTYGSYVELYFKLMRCSDENWNHNDYTGV